MNNSRIFTTEEKNEAMEFAYSMGLHRPHTAEVHESAMDFARAMGLKTQEVKTPAKRGRRFLTGLKFA